MHKCILLLFAPGRHVEYYADDCLLSGYEQPHTWKPRDKVDYTGCVVLDAREKGHDMIVSGPLLDVQMAEGEVDPLRRHGVRIPEWLRRVSAPDYVRYLTSHGAKQGVILDGRIEL